MGYFTRTQEAQLGFQSRGGVGGGEGSGDCVPVGRQVRSPPRPDSNLEKALVEGASGVFANGQGQKSKDDAAPVARLYQEIGQLTVERDFLAERSAP